ncbi:MAG: trehalose-phosphatase, partial [Usitatibacteraceae bacterium]
KGSALAVHERSDAEAAVALAAELADLCSRLAPGWVCLPGRHVVEIKPIGIDKGVGLESLISCRPFDGSFPVAIGDDVTDLDMFAATERLGGLTVAVGPRIAGSGRMELDSPSAVLRLLRRWSESGGVDSVHAVETLIRDAAQS